MLHGWGKLNAYRGLLGKRKERSIFGRPRCRWDGNTKMALQKITIVKRVD
jgi:hypothetical protein